MPLKASIQKKNIKIVLERRPNGLPVEEDFRIDTEELPVPKQGELLLENLYISLTPGDRLYMNRVIQINSVIRAHTISRVIDSNKNRTYVEGDIVLSRSGWQTYFVASADQLAPIQTKINPVTVNLGVLGAQGFTAYFGLLKIGMPALNETVVISGASGVVGSIAGQIAKIRGCKVIAICSDNIQKKNWLINDLLFDELVDESDLIQSLFTVCNEGIDVFFDNVGGEILDIVLGFIGKRGNKHARIVNCGMRSQYNRKKGEPFYCINNLQTIINQRVRMEGFIVGDYKEFYPEAFADLEWWIKEGKVKFKEDITQGLENAPKAFIRLMNRDIFGKCLIQL